MSMKAMFDVHAETRANMIRRQRPWRHTERITWAQLTRMRNEFWNAAPQNGGRPEIWEALQVAADTELRYAQAIIDSNSIILGNPDMTVCYDDGGTRYELPLFVLSEPMNLISPPSINNHRNMIDRILRRR
ncbi:hypothetical protein L6452_35613 [Arctium lappa]|uniref:Uncharacterized protein n=1 Tax=Arctium lappa TaxID=4217 RepID=A0ACB8Y7G8_ARCLA|nr:hypothetical protein L6452_35613 [Arctium lappa]